MTLHVKCGQVGAFVQCDTHDLIIDLLVPRSLSHLGSALNAWSGWSLSFLDLH